MFTLLEKLQQGFGRDAVTTLATFLALAVVAVVVLVVYIAKLHKERLEAKDAEHGKLEKIITDLREDYAELRSLSRDMTAALAKIKPRPRRREVSQVTRKAAVPDD